MRPMPQRMSWKGLLEYLACRSDGQFGTREPNAETYCQIHSAELVRVTALVVAVHFGIGADGECFGYVQHHRALPGEKPAAAYETTIPFWYCPQCDGDVPAMKLRTCAHTVPDFDLRRLVA